MLINAPRSNIKNDLHIDRIWFKIKFKKFSDIKNGYMKSSFQFLLL